MILIRILNICRYVGGQFSICNGVLSCSNIAMWDGSNWNLLGSASSNGITDPSFPIVNNKHYFPIIWLLSYETSYLFFLDRWLHCLWMETSCNKQKKKVFCKASFFQKSRYVGGGFQNASSSSGVQIVSNIAMWDGANWHPLGSGKIFKLILFASSLRVISKQARIVLWIHFLWMAQHCEFSKFSI